MFQDHIMRIIEHLLFIDRHQSIAIEAKWTIEILSLTLFKIVRWFLNKLLRE